MRNGHASISKTSGVVYKYRYIYIYLYMYMCIYVYMYIFIDVYVYICIYVYMYMCICVYMYICIYVYVYIYMYLRIYVSMYLCIYIIYLGRNRSMVGDTWHWYQEWILSRRMNDLRRAHIGTSLEMPLDVEKQFPEI